MFAQFSIQRSDQPWIVLEPTTTCLTSQLLSLDKARSTCLERENMFGPHLCQWIQTGAFLQSMFLSLQFPCVIMPPPPFFSLLLRPTLTTRARGRLVRHGSHDDDPLVRRLICVEAARSAPQLSSFINDHAHAAAARVPCCRRRVPGTLVPCCRHCFHRESALRR